MSIISEIKSSKWPICNQQNLNLKVVKANQVKIGEKSLKVLGPKIWNRLSPHIKNTENLLAFKRLRTTKEGVLCKCNLCKKI